MNDMVKMVASLVIFATVACVALAFVYDATESTIAGHAARSLEAAQKELFPEADSFSPITLTAASANVLIDASWSVAAGGGITGVAVRAKSAGFNDDITAIVGIKADGTIAGVQILTITDTPGLGANAASPTYFVDKQNRTTFYGQFAGMNAAPAERIAVAKDGGGVIAITAATISSRAVSAIVREAARAGHEFLASNGGSTR